MKPRKRDKELTRLSGLGAGSIEFGRIGYGAANLGNLYQEISDEESAEILAAAWDAGIRHFDTAPHYGLGLSERRLGAFLRTKPRDDFVISTKVGRLLRPNPDFSGELDLANSFMVPAETIRIWDPTPQGVRASLHESLARLGLDRIDVVYLHDPERYDLRAGIETALPALADLRDSGVVRAIGVGSMSTPALLASAQTGLIDVLMIAGRYTLADQPVIPEVIEACVQHSVGIVTAAVFNSGLLASDHPATNSRYDYGEVPASVLHRVLEISKICDEMAVELPTAALQYTLRDPAVLSVVVGSSTPQQIRQNVARIHQEISTSFWDRLVTEHLIPE